MTTISTALTLLVMSQACASGHRSPRLRRLGASTTKSRSAWPFAARAGAKLGIAVSHDKAKNGASEGSPAWPGLERADVFPRGV